MTIDIQALTAANASLLHSVAADVFDNDIRPDSLEAFLKDPRHFMFLAVDGQLVVGMVSAVQYVHPDKAEELWINEIGVAPTHRRRGIGRQLIAAIVGLGRARDCACAWVCTEVENRSAQLFYKALPEVRKAQSIRLYEWDFAD